MKTYNVDIQFETDTVLDYDTLLYLLEDCISNIEVRLKVRGIEAKGIGGNAYEEGRL